MLMFAHEEQVIAKETFLHRLDDFLRTPAVAITLISLLAGVVLAACIIYIYRSSLSGKKLNPAAGPKRKEAK